MAAVTVKIDGKMARWVQLLEDFGHLTPEDADRLLVGVAEVMRIPGRSGREIGSPDRPAPVNPRDLRRAAAMILFNQNPEPGRALEDDWPLMFS